MKEVMAAEGDVTRSLFSAPLLRTALLYPVCAVCFPVVITRHTDARWLSQMRRKAALSRKMLVVGYM